MTAITISSFAIIGFAAFIHASFQLSVSVLTLLSGHSIGKKTAHRKVLRLMNGFILGAIAGTVMLLSTISYYLSLGITHQTSAERLAASVICGGMVGLGIAVWAIYYRRGDSTALWLPRGFASYLTKRSKATRNAAESFSLGLASLIAELLFIIGPLFAASIAIVTLPDVTWRLFGIATYTIIATLPLIVVTLLVGGGHTITRLQRWRLSHKRFLQFTASGGLLVLAAFLFVDRAIGIGTYGGLW
ncbi:MAG: hypothetical protein Q4A37_02880 [Candidatus Saccharibacteria bacterium]|nr:hypothetical protein [Candidatus Saccharibacteria bacterium]